MRTFKLIAISIAFFAATTAADFFQRQDKLLWGPDRDKFGGTYKVATPDEDGGYWWSYKSGEASVKIYNVNEEDFVDWESGLGLDGSVWADGGFTVTDEEADDIIDENGLKIKLTTGASGDNDAGISFWFKENQTEETITDGKGFYIEYKNNGDDVKLVLCSTCDNSSGYTTVATLENTDDEVVKLNIPWDSDDPVSAKQFRILINGNSKEAIFTLKKLGWLREFPTVGAKTITYSEGLTIGGLSTTLAAVPNSLGAGYTFTGISGTAVSANAAAQSFAAKYITTTDDAGTTADGYGSYAGLESIEGTISVTVNKKEPTSSDFSALTIPDTDETPIYYNGSGHGATVTPETRTGFGTVATTYKLKGTETALSSAPTNAGTYIVTVSVSGGTNYSDKNFELGEYTISQHIPTTGDLAYTAPTTINHTYNGEQQDIGSVVGSTPANIALLGTISVTYNDQSTKPTNAGEYTVKAVIAGTANCEAKTLTLGTYTIGKATVVAAMHLNYNAETVIYNGSEQPIDAVSLKPGFDGLGAIGEVKYNGNETPKDAKIYALTVDIAEGSNFEAASNLSLGDYEIEKAPLTITAKNYVVKTEIGEEPIEYGYTVSGLVGDETEAEIITNDPVFILDGVFENTEEKEFDIIISYGGTINSNYDVTYVSGTLTVTNRNILELTDIVFAAASKIYNGSEQEPEGARLAESITAGTSPVWAYTYTAVTGDLSAGNKPLNAGTYNITVKYVDSENFYESENPVEFSITPKTLEITGLTGITKAYDASTVVNLEALTLGFSGLVDGETADVNIAGVSANYNNANASSTSKAITFTGNFTMTEGTAKAKNYAITQPTGVTGTITKAAGAPVEAPTTVTSTTTNSITISAVTAPANGQTVEYYIHTSSDAASILAATWQAGTTFSNLTASTPYWIFARSKADDNHFTGSASSGYNVATLSSSGGNNSSSSGTSSSNGSSSSVGGGASSSSVGGGSDNGCIGSCSNYTKPTPVLSQAVGISNKAVQLANGLNLSVNSKAVVNVYGLKGNLVQSTSYANGNHIVSFGSLPKGMYIVKVSFSGSESKVMRMAVK